MGVVVTRLPGEMADVTMPLPTLLGLLCLALPSHPTGSVYQVFNQIDTNTLGPFFRPRQVTPYPIFTQFSANPYYQFKQQYSTIEKRKKSQKIEKYYQLSKPSRLQKLESNYVGQNKEEDEDIERETGGAFKVEFDLHPEEKLSLVSFN